MQIKNNCFFTYHSDTVGKYGNNNRFVLIISMKSIMIYITNSGKDTSNNNHNSENFMFSWVIRLNKVLLSISTEENIIWISVNIFLSETNPYGRYTLK